MVRKSVIIAGSGFMLSVIALAVLKTGVLHGRGSDPFERYSAFMKSHPTLRIDFKNQIGGGSDSTGSVLFQRPFNTLMKVQTPTDNFTAANTSKGYVEVDSTSHEYEEGPAAKGVTLRGSRISSSPSRCPGLALGMDLRRNLPQNPKVTSTATGDEIYGTAQSPMGTTEVWVNVNAAGEIEHYRVKSVAMHKVSEATWDLTYTIPTHVSEADFALPLPLGYFPYALAPEKFPLQKGKAAPVTGWLPSHGSTPIDLLEHTGHRKFLLAILDTDQPSSLSLKSLKRLKSSIPVEIVGKGFLRDPGGTRIASLNPSGYPMFYLLDGSGKVLHLWLGFDPAKGSEFEQQVLDSSKGDTAPRKP